MPEKEPTRVSEIPQLAEQGRVPFLIDAVLCVIPPERASFGKWSAVDECEFFTKSGETLGQGEVVILHPQAAARLDEQLRGIREQNQQVQ